MEQIVKLWEGINKDKVFIEVRNSSCNLQGALMLIGKDCMSNTMSYQELLTTISRGEIARCPLLPLFIESSSLSLSKHATTF
jgi:hypothetical protein